MQDCIFCKIVSGEFESSKIYEDDKILAFLDVQPITKGHTLIIPKKHTEFISETNEDILGHIFKVSKKINVALRKSGIKCEAVGYILADGKSANQEVPHVHLHLVPRNEGDDFGLKFPEGYPKMSKREDLNNQAEKIKKQI